MCTSVYGYIVSHLSDIFVFGNTKFKYLYIFENYENLTPYCVSKVFEIMWI